MRSLLRRWFRCRRGAHRDTLSIRRTMMAVKCYTLWWECLDCGDRRFVAYSDTLDAESQPKSERVA
jgi:hypothetical protein